VAELVVASAVCCPQLLPQPCCKALPQERNTERHTERHTEPQRNLLSTYGQTFLHTSRFAAHLASHRASPGRARTLRHATLAFRPCLHGTQRVLQTGTLAVFRRSTVAAGHLTQLLHALVAADRLSHLPSTGTTLTFLHRHRLPDIFARGASCRRSGLAAHVHSRESLWPLNDP